MLSMTAVRRCGLAIMPSHYYGMDAFGQKMDVMEATNITIKLSENIDIHWRVAIVQPDASSGHSETNDSFFGVFDYGTLIKKNAVMDMNRKTLMITK